MAISDGSYARVTLSSGTAVNSWNTTAVNQIIWNGNPLQYMPMVTTFTPQPWTGQVGVFGGDWGTTPAAEHEFLGTEMMPGLGISYCQQCSAMDPDRFNASGHAHTIEEEADLLELLAA